LASAADLQQTAQRMSGEQFSVTSVTQLTQASASSYYYHCYYYTYNVDNAIIIN